MCLIVTESLRSMWFLGAWAIRAIPVVSSALYTLRSEPLKHRVAVLARFMISILRVWGL